MDSRISRKVWRFLTSLALISFAAFGIAAQDPDPNSPTPILLSESGSTRALAQKPGKLSGKADLGKIVSQAFLPDEKVELFVTNLRLMENEGPNAFRVYAQDKSGHQFKFPVLAIEEIPAISGLYRVTITLRDEVGFWDAPTPDGDILISITWRGMASNRVRLGLGKMGGEIKDDPGAVPTPFGTPAAAPSRIQSPDETGYRWSGDRLRFLEQATFGPNLTLDNKIRRVGLRAWINEQFETPYPTIPYPNQPLKPNTAPADCDNNNTTTVPDVPETCFRDTYTMYQPQTWFFKEAFYGDAQLRHRVAWALAQIWVTSGVEILQGRQMVEYHKVLSNNAFGNYRNLMKQMTLNPAMGQYLDMQISTRTNPNENYAREIMQLFTVGLFMLKPNGKLDCVERPLPTDTCLGSDTPIPTYDQNGVNNLTRVLTGWRFCSVQASCPNLTPGVVDYIDPMVVNIGQNTNNIANNLHDTAAKTLLNYPSRPD